MAGGGEFLLFGDDLATPPLEGITNYGCTCLTLNNGTVRASGWADYDAEHLENVRKQRFSLEFQKEYPHRGWAHFISQRAGKKADFEAAKDCVEWTRGVKRLLVQTTKGEVKK